MGIKENLEIINGRIESACQRSGRKASDVKLLAVSKQVEAQRIKAAHDCGHKTFGENYVQEFISKFEELSDKGDIEWHFIGHLQKNKVKYIIDKVIMIHSVDKLSLAQEINKRAGNLNITIPVLIEVNLGDEQSKSGIQEGELEGFVEQISELGSIDVCGLMALPPYSDNPEDSRKYFIRLRELRDRLKNSYNILSELSMGMSGDFEVAIEEGATMVRVGTAIFGERPKKNEG